MKRYLPAWIAVAITLPILDFVWFALVAATFYRSQIGPMLLPQARLGPAAIFYLGYATGIVLFVVAPAAGRGGFQRAASMGLVFGLISYGVYDLTNLATLKGFTVTVAIIDMAWGGFATAIAAALGTLTIGVGRNPTSHAVRPT